MTDRSLACRSARGHEESDTNKRLNDKRMKTLVTVSATSQARARGLGNIHTPMRILWTGNHTSKQTVMAASRKALRTTSSPGQDLSLTLTFSLHDTEASYCLIWPLFPEVPIENSCPRIENRLEEEWERVSMFPSRGDDCYISSSSIQKNGPILHLKEWS